MKGEDIYDQNEKRNSLKQSTHSERKALNDIVNNCKLEYKSAWNLIAIKFNVPNDTNRNEWLQENRLCKDATDFLYIILSK